MEVVYVCTKKLVCTNKSCYNSFKILNISSTNNITVAKEVFIVRTITPLVHTSCNSLYL